MRRLQGRLHRPPRAVPVLRLDREPAPPDGRPTAASCTGRTASRASAADTQSFSGAYGNGPQFDTPNHNYDTSDFDQLVAAINAGKLPASALPAVTFLKAPGLRGRPCAYSNPRDEQAFVVDEINALEQSPDWSSTAVIVNYDDSDGWYDHVYSGVTNPSHSVADNLTNTALGKIRRGEPDLGAVRPERAARRSAGSRAAAASARGCR